MVCGILVWFGCLLKAFLSSWSQAGFTNHFARKHTVAFSCWPKTLLMCEGQKLWLPTGREDGRTCDVWQSCNKGRTPSPGWAGVQMRHLEDMSLLRESPMGCLVFLFWAPSALLPVASGSKEYWVSRGGVKILLIIPGNTQLWGGAKSAGEGNKLEH